MGSAGENGGKDVKYPFGYALDGKCEKEALSKSGVASFYFVARCIALS